MKPQKSETFETRTGAPGQSRVFSAAAGPQTDPPAWRALLATDADVLIIGERAAITHVLNQVWCRLRNPIFWVDARRVSWLPDPCESTLILEHAHELKMCDQRRLLDWLSAGPRSARLIATASRPLWPLVEAGAFSRSLYERIATVRLMVAN